MLTYEVIRMSVKYEVLKKLVVATGLKKRWLSATTEELLENRSKQNVKNRMMMLLKSAELTSWVFQC